MGYLLLFLFIGYYGSITLFWHTHYSGNETITHSHPFNNPNHAHTAAQYDLIKLLSTVAGLLFGGGLLLAKLYSGKPQSIIAKPKIHLFQHYLSSYFRRGPPALYTI